MELLPEGKRNTATEVSWEDQQKINAFSALIGVRDEKSDFLKAIKEEKEYLDDLALEIELLDEDEKVQHKIGDIFVFLEVQKAVEKVEEENRALSIKIEHAESVVDELDGRLKSLKAELYAKFGSNINLER